MPIVLQPKPLPSPLDYVPSQSVPHRVHTGDNWWKLADRPEVKAAGLSPLDLCYFNFRTRKPSEINWYLRNKVGCKITTYDGNNYKFTSSDVPGIIHLPALGPKPPANEYPKEERTNAWIGIGGKAGTQFFVVGIETLGGYVASLDDVGKGMALSASINRVGPGIGASGGITIIYVTGVKTPSDLRGHQQGGWDFNAALGASWGKMGKSAAQMKRLKPLIDKLRRIGAKSPAGLKSALKADPDDWMDLTKTARTFREYLGIDPNAEPNVLMIDLPISGGFEGSVYYGVANFEALWDFTD